MLRTALVRGAFEYQGQKCSAASRAYVPAQRLGRGCATSSSAQTEALPMGDVADFSQLHGRGHRRALVRQARPGARRAPSDDPALRSLAGGTADDSEGYFVRPDRWSRAPTRRTRCSRTEYFGPVLAVHVYDDADYDDRAHADGVGVARTR